RREEERRRMELMLPFVLATPEGRALIGMLDEEATGESSSPYKPKLVEIPSRAEEPQKIQEEGLVNTMTASPAGQVPAVSKQASPRRDWNTLLARTRAAAPVATESPLLTAVMEATATDLARTSTVPLPSGFQDNDVVAELIANKHPVSGLVMAVAVST